MSITDTAKETADLLKNLEHVSGFLTKLKQDAMDRIIVEFELKDNLISSQWVVYRNQEKGLMTATFYVRYLINGKEDTYKEDVELHKLETQERVVKTVEAIFKNLLAKVMKDVFLNELVKALRDATNSGIIRTGR